MRSSCFWNLGVGPRLPEQVAKAEELVDADAEGARELGQQRCGHARASDLVIGVGLLQDLELVGEGLLRGPVPCVARQSLRPAR